MSEAVQIALITSMPIMLGAILKFMADLLREVKKTQALAQRTEENTNHLKDELVALTAKSSHAEGKLEGQKEAKEN